MKTAMTIIAELVRSLVLSGLAAAALVLMLTVGAATAGFGLWRWWRRTRR